MTCSTGSHRLHSLAEEIEIKLLKLGAGERLREVVSVLEGFDLEPGRSPFLLHALVCPMREDRSRRLCQSSSCTA